MIMAGLLILNDVDYSISQYENTSTDYQLENELRIMTDSLQYIKVSTVGNTGQVAKSSNNCNKYL